MVQRPFNAPQNSLVQLSDGADRRPISLRWLAKARVALTGPFAIVRSGGCGRITESKQQAHSLCLNGGHSRLGKFKSETGRWLLWVLYAGLQLDDKYDTYSPLAWTSSLCGRGASDIRSMKEDGDFSCTHEPLLIRSPLDSQR